MSCLLVHHFALLSEMKTQSLLVSDLLWLIVCFVIGAAVKRMKDSDGVSEDQF